VPSAGSNLKFIVNRRDPQFQLSIKAGPGIIVCVQFPFLAVYNADRRKNSV
jgi:hypothetical protein